MNNEIFEKYKNEMLKMYENSKKNSTFISTNASEADIDSPNTQINQPENSENGMLLGVVTSFRELYPVKNAKVTIFTGDFENMNVIDSDFTDESGKTKRFVLDTPDKSLSLSPNLIDNIYSLYNMAVESDGYLTNIHLNIPVFSGITSIQRSDLVLAETSNGENRTQVFDESSKYNL